MESIKQTLIAQIQPRFLCQNQLEQQSHQSVSQNQQQLHSLSSLGQKQPTK